MKKQIRGLVIAIICISAVVGLYYYLTHIRAQQNVENQVELTEVEKVLTKDLEKSYPMTPREVITFYNRILGCIYNEEYTQEQFEGLASQIRMLMDEELLSENPEEEYLRSLDADVASYKALEKQIATTKVSDSADVQYKTVNGDECAYVSSSYFIKEGDTSYEKTVQRYVLRKDSVENWKIVGFYLVEGENLNE